jgi:hypothetical protein
LEIRREHGIRMTDEMCGPTKIVKEKFDSMYVNRDRMRKKGLLCARVKPVLPDFKI